MIRAIEFLISLLIVALLFVLVGLFLPSQRMFTQTIETNRSMTAVFDLLNGFARFKDWNALTKYDPNVALEITGEPSGVGARLDYQSADQAIGSGSWQIVESVPGERIRYRLENNAMGSDKEIVFEFERTGQTRQNVRITQTYTVDYGWNLIGRYAGMYVNRSVGDGIKRGMAELSNLLATIPKFDYGTHGKPFEFVEIPAADLLIVTTSARRSNDEVAQQMTTQMEWIRKVMDENGLLSAGPMRIITNEFTPDVYSFDVAQPVRLATVAEGAPLPEQLLSVTLDGPVQYQRVPARRAAVTTFVGPAPGLPRARDFLRAWSVVRGADPSDRPYEDFNVPVADMYSETAEFRVVWPVK
jgi:hypothetical protein